MTALTGLKNDVLPNLLCGRREISAEEWAEIGIANQSHKTQKGKVEQPLEYLQHDLTACFAAAFAQVITGLFPKITSFTEE